MNYKESTNHSINVRAASSSIPHLSPTLIQSLSLPSTSRMHVQDCVAVERILAERICEVDSSDTGIIATAGGAVWFDRQNRGPDAGEEDAGA